MCIARQPYPPRWKWITRFVGRARSRRGEIFKSRACSSRHHPFAFRQSELARLCPSNVFFFSRVRERCRLDVCTPNFQLNSKVTVLYSLRPLYNDDEFSINFWWFIITVCASWLAVFECRRHLKFKRYSIHSRGGSECTHSSTFVTSANCALISQAIYMGQLITASK